MNTSCEELEHELTAFVDGELPAERRKVIEKHLTICPTCRKETDELEKTTLFLKDVYSSDEGPAVDLSGLWEKIESQIDFRPTIWQRLKERFQKPIVWIPATVATAAIALLILFMPFSKQPVPVGLISVESVYSQTGQVMIMKTAKSGQPLIWILPGAGKEAG